MIPLQNRELLSPERQMAWIQRGREQLAAAGIVFPEPAYVPSYAKDGGPQWCPETAATLATISPRGGVGPFGLYGGSEAANMRIDKPAIVLYDGPTTLVVYHSTSISGDALDAIVASAVGRMHGDRLRGPAHELARLQQLATSLPSPETYRSDGVVLSRIPLIVDRQRQHDTDYLTTLAERVHAAFPTVDAKGIEIEWGVRVLPGTLCETRGIVPSIGTAYSLAKP
jgi:hypothetical protein